MGTKKELFDEHIAKSNVAEALALGEAIGWENIDLNLAIRNACVSQSEKMINELYAKFEIAKQMPDHRTNKLIEKFLQNNKKNVDNGIMFS